MVKYTAEYYKGCIIGNSYMVRVGYQVVATDAETGKRRAVFGEPGHKTPCLKSNWVAFHYISGCNKYDTELLEGYKAWAQKTATKLNNNEV